MLGLKPSLFALSLVGLTVAAPLTKRATTLVSGSSKSSQGYGLWAYGDGISGLPIFFADDLAYIGDCDLLNATVSSNVTFYQWKSLGAIGASTNSTTESFSVMPYLYIVADSSAPVGFTSTDAAAPDGAVTTGWDWYGTQLMYDGDSYDESYFFAQTTDTDNVYQLLWVDDGSASDDLIVLQVKAQGPSQYAVGDA